MDPDFQWMIAFFILMIAFFKTIRNVTNSFVLRVSAWVLSRIFQGRRFPPMLICTENKESFI